MHIKNRLEYLIKHNNIVQFLYKTVLSFIFRFLGLFIKTDRKLILFNSFGGREFNDSPKVLFEVIRNDPRFNGFRLIWAFEEPKKFTIPGAECIKIDSLSYFLIALKAGVWVSSVNIERGLHFKKKDTLYINTWHGAGTKLIGNACKGRKDYDFSNVDIMLVQSEFEKHIFERDFLCNPSSIRKVGFPRNDELFYVTNDLRKELRRQFNIPESKKVILYAPTWRDSRNGGGSYEFVPPFHINKWKEAFFSDYVMLFRTHAFTTSFSMTYDDFARDVSSYSNLNHILAITDVLVTDYSTIVYDSSIAEIPFICFGFDYKQYKEDRGFYYDLDEVYPGGVLYSEDEVIERIPLVISGEKKDEYAAFKARFIEAGGSATLNVLEELANRLEIE